MKRAQTEVFGLVIIVLLLSVGLLFAIGFMAKKEPVSFRKQFLQTEISYNLLEAILETTVILDQTSYCHNLRITELIQDCYENQGYTLSCTPTQIPPQDSCSYAETLINDTLLRNTLDKWGYKYQLIFSGTQIPEISNAPCTGERKAITYVIPTRMGNVEVKT